MASLEAYPAESSIEKSLRELIKLRVSQMNGCAFCIDKHWKDARAMGGSEQRLYSLDAWREAPFYSDRERAALRWAESITKIAEGHVPDEVYNAARAEFSEREMADLTLAAVAIKGWNRLAIASRKTVGDYQPKTEPPG